MSYKKNKYKEQIENESNDSASKKSTLGNRLSLAAMGAKLGLGHMLGKMSPADITSETMNNMVSEFNKKNNANVVLRMGRNISGSSTFRKDSKLPKSIHNQALLKKKFGHDIYEAFDDAKKNNKTLLSSMNNEATLLHELGHARYIDKNKNGLLKANTALGIASAPLGFKTVRKGLRKIDKTKDGKMNKAVDFLENNPELVLGATKLPKLIDEARASTYATKQLVSKYGLKGGLKKAAPLGVALGTYGLGALAPTLAQGQYIRNTKTREE